MQVAQNRMLVKRKEQKAGLWCFMFGGEGTGGVLHKSCLVITAS